VLPVETGDPDNSPADVIGVYNDQLPPGLAGTAASARAASIARGGGVGAVGGAAVMGGPAEKHRDPACAYCVFSLHQARVYLQM